MNLPSKILENAVYEISQLPSIGKRSALRLALHLLKQPSSQTESLARALVSLRNDLIYCENCHNVSDEPICQICSSPNRDASIICVVEDVRDVLAIEHTGQFLGHYHILGGKISPIDGIGPNQLNINSLIEKAKSGNVKEIIFALSNTMEADTTNFYIFKQLEKYEISISTIARGISVGDELQYADEVTLGRSILHRVPFENSLKM